LTLSSPSPAAFELVSHIAAAHARLAEHPLAHAEAGLGGRLFYAGALDDSGCVWLAAANIAGAASLAATADPAAQKQALRNGAADFLVASLDEALRILKNQLRKREPAAVCAGLSTDLVEAEMRERGVVADLTRAGLESQTAPHGAPEYLTWTVAAAPARWLPMMDALALDCLNPQDDQFAAARRWLKLAPRFLPRPAANLRLLICGRTFADRFIARLRDQIERGQIPVAVDLHSHFGGQSDAFNFTPRPC
jgi:hypothetical protein